MNVFCEEFSADVGQMQLRWKKNVCVNKLYVNVTLIFWSFLSDFPFRNTSKA